MKVEEFVEDGTYVIRAEIPGIDPDKDVDITVADGILHLTATREERSEEERPEGYRTEFHYGSLRRSIRLPEGASRRHHRQLQRRHPRGASSAPKEVEKPTAKIAVTRG